MRWKCNGGPLQRPEWLADTIQPTNPDEKTNYKKISRRTIWQKKRDKSGKTPDKKALDNQANKSSKGTNTP